MGSAAPTDLGPGKAPTHLRHRVLGPFKVARRSEYPKDGVAPPQPTQRRDTDHPAFVRLDEVDRAILSELVTDARVRTAELGRRVGLSAPPTSERVRRLEDAGVVSYRAEVDPKALGYVICAIVRVSPTTRDLRQIPEIARAIPEITECYRITGEDCYFMTLHLRFIDDLESVLDRFTPTGTPPLPSSTPLPSPAERCRSPNLRRHERPGAAGRCGNRLRDAGRRDRTLMRVE